VTTSYIQGTLFNYLTQFGFFRGLITDWQLTKPSFIWQPESCVWHVHLWSDTWPSYSGHKIIFVQTARHTEALMDARRRQKFLRFPGRLRTMFQHGMRCHWSSQIRMWSQVYTYCPSKILPMLISKSQRIHETLFCANRSRDIDKGDVINIWACDRWPSVKWNFCISQAKVTQSRTEVVPAGI